jgi:hypothetical protein
MTNQPRHRGPEQRQPEPHQNPSRTRPIDTWAGGAGVDARAAVNGVGHEVYTGSEAVAEADRGAGQIVVWRLDEVRAGAGEAGGAGTVPAAGAAVVRIDAEIDAEGAAQGQPRRARFRLPGADSSLARLSQDAGDAAGPAVDHAGHHVGAVAAAVGRARGTLRRHADAVLAILVEPARVLAGAAVVDVLGQIAAAIGRAAIFEADRAVGALADSGAARDGDEPAFAHGATGPAVVQVGGEIDAESTAAGQARRALARALTLAVRAALARGAGGATGPAVARVVAEVGAIAVDPLGRAGRLATIDPAQGADALPDGADEAAHVRAEGVAGAAMLAIGLEFDTVRPAAREAGSAAVGRSVIVGPAITLAFGHRVPVAEVARLWPGRQAIDRAPAFGDLPLADADRDQRVPLAGGDAHLQDVAGRLADDGELLPARQEKDTVLQVASVGERKGQLAAHLVQGHPLGQGALGGRPQAHRGGEVEGAGPPLGANRGNGTAAAEGLQQAASHGSAERGAARGGSGKTPGQGIEAFGVHHLSSAAAMRDRATPSPVVYSGVSSSGLTRGKQVSGVTYVHSSSVISFGGSSSPPPPLCIGWSAV